MTAPVIYYGLKQDRHRLNRLRWLNMAVINKSLFMMAKTRLACDSPSVTIAGTVYEQYLIRYFGSLNEILPSLVCT
jgi:hypothetical protein